MLIPSIDLMGGRVVQLEQGERLALASDDIDGWAERFAAFPVVQVIDLDAAMGRGANDAIVRRLCGRLTCQVGGGIRTPERARAVLDAGARRVIVGSSLFTADGVDVAAASRFAGEVPRDQFIAAVDSRHGRVVIHGWKTTIPISAGEAVRQLEPFAGAFLYTHVDTEGLLGGIDMAAVRAVAAATTRPVIAAGGIRSQAEIDTLDRAGINAVVGMAIYRGLLKLA
jgi:phosphoribosylformimino-5-aminoimidazole carboxamide ribotide isomerase